ncbi:Terpene cyclase dpasB [Dirofilaria immitis]
MDEISAEISGGNQYRSINQCRLNLSATEITEISDIRTFKMWLSLLPLICPFIIEQTIGGILNKKIPISDNDNTLQQIISKPGILYTNSKLPYSETNWWIPIPGHSLKATVVRTYNKRTGKYYATYNYFPINARTLCNKNTVALSGLKSCKLVTPIIHYQECKIIKTNECLVIKRITLSIQPRIFM